MISDYAHVNERGTAFGWYHLMSGIAVIPAGLLFGTIWYLHNAMLAFLCASVLAALAAILLRVWAWPIREYVANQNRES